MAAAPVITPADLAALIARTQQRGFSPTSHAGTAHPAGDAASAFRPARFGTMAPAPATAPNPPQEQPAPPRDPAADLAQAHAEGFAAGMAKGREQALAEAHATARAEAERQHAEAVDGLAQARTLFLTLANALSHPPADHLAALTQSLDQAVRRLAADRAGSAIDVTPAAFLCRVQMVADRVAQGTRQVTVTLHPDDLAALVPHIQDAPPMGLTFDSSVTLSRGDVVVQAPAIRLADLLMDGAA